MFLKLASYAALLLFSSAALSQQPAPDYVLVNGKIFTGDAAHPYVKALAIGGERILAVGDSANIQALAGPHTTQVDLGGRVVIPGINDAHIHLDIHPADWTELHIHSLNPSWSDLKAAIVKAPRSGGIFATIGPAVFSDPSVNRDALDEIAPNLPVVLTTLTGHASILNSAALARAGLHDGQADPMGGRYEKTADGRLTGVLREYAGMQLFRTLADQTSDADAISQLRESFAEFAKLGITSIQDMSNVMSPERCVALLKKVPTPIRVRVMRMAMTTPKGRDIEEGRSEPPHPAPLITVTGTKWMLDGVPVESTFEPRGGTAGQPPRSIDQGFAQLGMTFPKTELAAMLRESLKYNDQLLLHVSGYPAPAAMLEAMQAAGGKEVWGQRRVRFEHGDGLYPDLVPQVKSLGIVVVQNPSHMSMRAMMPEMFGGKPLERSQPFRSLLDAGIPVALGSDGPDNPYLNIMFATTHANRPSEAITREQAVIAYTATSAYAEFEEKDKGTIAPGKLADLAVLSQDIFAVPLPDLPKTVSLMTFVGGKVIYDAMSAQPQ
ncbi:MAG: amidohydrolase [Acidobacteriota bacterium]|nr:amidohydrolase [Acidobacteriota bacterium]